MTGPVIRAMGSGFISHSLNLYLAFALGSTCPLALMSSLCSPCHRAHVPTCPLALRRAMCAQPPTAYTCLMFLTPFVPITPAAG